MNTKPCCKEPRQDIQFTKCFHCLRCGYEECSAGRPEDHQPQEVKAVDPVSATMSAYFDAQMEKMPPLHINTPDIPLDTRPPGAMCEHKMKVGKGTGVYCCDCEKVIGTLVEVGGTTAPTPPQEATESEWELDSDYIKLKERMGMEGSIASIHGLGNYDGPYLQDVIRKLLAQERARVVEMVEGMANGLTKELPQVDSLWTPREIIEAYAYNLALTDVIALIKNNQHER